MKKKKIRTLYNRALSMALVVSTTASFCLGVSGVTSAMEEQRRAKEATEEVVSGERHHHTFACYEEYELDCKENHSENEHRRSCYRYSGERICGLEDGALHLHGPECEVAAKVLICGEDENVSGEILDEQDEEMTGETADNEGSGESTVDDGSVSGEIVDDGTEGGEVTDGGAEGSEVAGDGIDGDGIDGDEIAGDEITGDEITGDETVGDETNGGEDNTAGNTGEETNSSDSVESSEEETNGSDGAGEETLESGSAGEETTGSADAGKETTGSADAGEETTGSADAGKETTGSADAGEETTGSVDAEGSKEETDASDNVGEESSSGSNDKETADIENAGEETAASDSAGKETAGLESAGKESAGSENADGGNSGSGEWNNGEETSSGEKTNISAEKSGRDRFSLLAVNQHSYGSPLFPQLYIESPLNALLDKILPEEELLTDEDGTVNETDNESETVNDETEKTEDADNGKEHQHSEECYKIIYQCRAGVATMALREGGVANEGDLRSAITNSNGATIINIAEDFAITSTIEISTGKNITIDLQGNTLTYNGTNAADSMFKVDSGTLTIKDSLNAQQGAEKVSEEVVSEAEEASYDETTGRLTYYVTECSVNLDGKSTTNTIKKYVYDLGINNNANTIGTLDGCDKVTSIISAKDGNVIIDSGCLKNSNGSGIAAKTANISMNKGYIVNCGIEDKKGGAISLSGGTLMMIDGVIANNDGLQGGAISAENWATITITGGFIFGNKAKHNGGGIYGSVVKINIGGSASIVANKANESGGGIYFTGGNYSFGDEIIRLDITGGEIIGNTAELNGGGIGYLTSSPNKVTPEKPDNKGNRIIQNAKIKNNHAKRSGGGIYLSGSELELGGDASICANIADLNGGGIYCIVPTEDHIHPNASKNSTAKISGNVKIAANIAKNQPNSYSTDETSQVSITNHEGYIEKQWFNTEITQVNDFYGLKQAIENASENAAGLKSQAIELKNDIDADEKIDIGTNTDITLILNGYNIKDDQADNKSESLFYISGENSSLTIKNKTSDEGILGPTPKIVNDNQIGKAGSYDKGTQQLTYYVTESIVQNDLIHTKESTYQYTMNLKSDTDKIGELIGNDIDSVIKADNGGKVTIEGGIITGAKHGIKLGNKAAMVMRGGYIVGCGSEVSSIDNTTTGDDGNSPENGAGIYANGAAGIQIFDGVIAGNTTSKRGGGIFSNAGIVEIKGGIIAANIAGNIGGGICAQGTTVTTIGNSIKNETEAIPSLVISGNTAKAREILSDKKGNVNLGGGGIFTGSTAKLFILQNAYITNNRAERIPEITTDGIRDGGNLGGGGVLSSGEMEMSGSFVTANYSAASGGGIFSYSGNNSENIFSGKIILTGGIIAGNYAKYSEGGGLRINWRGEIKSAEGNKIYITNNRTDTTTNWGGGGIFNTSGAYTEISDVLITDNAAKGFGGGIAGCNHGTNRIFVDHGGAIFANTANGSSPKHSSPNGEIFAKHDNKNFADCVDARTEVIKTNGESVDFKDFMYTEDLDPSFNDKRPSYQDFYCSNVSRIFGQMLGGGNAHWRGCYSNDDKTTLYPKAYPLAIEGSEKEIYAESANLMGLTSHPSESDRIAAISMANIYITGNQSAAHGAGVMTNGTFSIGGTGIPGNGSLTIKKEIDNINGVEVPENKTFAFVIEITDENEKVLSNNEGKPMFDYEIKEGTKVIKNGEVDLSKEVEINISTKQTYTILGLPDSVYCIKEQPDEFFEAKDGDNHKDGIILKGSETIVTFVNIPKASLKITKEVHNREGKVVSDKNVFTFVIQVKDKNNQELTGSYSTVKEPVSSVEGGLEKGNIVFGEGILTEISLQGGQSFLIYNLPNGVHYTITEKLDDSGYVAENGNNVQTGIIEESTEATVKFVNVPKQQENKYASLLIKKELQDSEGDKIDNNHQLFTFALRLKDSDKKDITGEYSFTKTPFDSAVDKEGPVGVLKFEENFYQNTF